MYVWFRYTVVANNSGNGNIQARCIFWKGFYEKIELESKIGVSPTAAPEDC